MSDENRNDAGQFTPAEPLTGQAGIEADHGYKRMPEDEAPPEPSSDIMEEVKRLQESREPVNDPIVEVQYQRLETGAKAPENETVSLERAADDLTAYHGQQDEERARSVSSDFAAEIDKMRGEAIKDNPDIAKDLALSKEEIAAAEAAKEPSPSETNDAARAEMAQQSTSEPDPYDIEGLDEPTKAAMRVPQIREAVEKEITKAAETQQAYTAGLNSAQQFGQAAILALAPELGNVPLDRWAEAVNIIAQSDPARGQQLGRMFQNVAALSERQQLVAQHQQQVSRQHFESYVKSEDARFEPLAKAEGLTADYSKILSYWEGQGLNRNQILQLYQNNPAAASAEARLLVLKAARYDEMMKAAKPRATKELPPVTRPASGAMHARGDSDSTKIASLRAKVSSSSGHAAIRAAAELQRAMRKA